MKTFRVASSSPVKQNCKESHFPGRMCVFECSKASSVWILGCWWLVSACFPPAVSLLPSPSSFPACLLSILLDFTLRTLLSQGSLPLERGGWWASYPRVVASLSNDPIAAVTASVASAPADLPSLFMGKGFLTLWGSLMVQFSVCSLRWFHWCP